MDYLGEEFLRSLTLVPERPVVWLELQEGLGVLVLAPELPRALALQALV